MFVRMFRSEPEAFTHVSSPTEMNDPTHRSKGSKTGPSVYYVGNMFIFINKTSWILLIYGVRD